MLTVSAAVPDVSQDLCSLWSTRYTVLGGVGVGSAV